MNGASFAGGEVGQGFNFNGNQQSMQVPASAAWDFASHDGTIDFWTRITAMPPFVSGFLDQVDNDSNWVVFCYSDGRLGVSRAGVNQIVSAAGVITAGVWLHIAITRSQGTTSLFVNGNLVGSGTVPVWTSTSNPLRIGSYFYNGAQDLNGVMDEIDVFDRALSVEEIQSIYQAGTAGKAQVLFSDNFDSGASPQWGNESGNWAATGGLQCPRSHHAQYFHFALHPH
jgi:hypothetical protein